MKKRIIGIGAITLVHAALTMSIAVRLWSAAGSPSQRLVGATAQVLFFPIAPVVLWCHKYFRHIFNVFPGCVPLLLNSFLWGVAIWMTWEWIQKKRIPNRQVQPIAGKPGSG